MSATAAQGGAYVPPFATRATTSAAATAATAATTAARATATSVSFASIGGGYGTASGAGTATSSAIIVDSTGGVDSNSLLEYFTKVSECWHQADDLPLELCARLTPISQPVALHRCAYTFNSNVAVCIHLVVRRCWNIGHLVLRLSLVRRVSRRERLGSLVSQILDQAYRFQRQDETKRRRGGQGCGRRSKERQVGESHVRANGGRSGSHRGGFMPESDWS